MTRQLPNPNAVAKCVDALSNATRNSLQRAANDLLREEALEACGAIGNDSTPLAVVVISGSNAYALAVAITEAVSAVRGDPHSHICLQINAADLLTKTGQSQN